MTWLCPPLATHEAAKLSRCFIVDGAARIRWRGDGVGGDAIAAVLPPPAAAADAFEGAQPSSLAMLAQRGDDRSGGVSHAFEDRSCSPSKALASV